MSTYPKHLHTSSGTGTGTGGGPSNRSSYNKYDTKILLNKLNIIQQRKDPSASTIPIPINRPESSTSLRRAGSATMNHRSIHVNTTTPTPTSSSPSPLTQTQPRTSNSNIYSTTMNLSSSAGVAAPYHKNINIHNK